MSKKSKITRRRFLRSSMLVVAGTVSAACTAPLATPTPENTPTPTPKPPPKDRDEVLEALALEVVTYLGQTHNCAQSTFAALKAQFELGDKDDAVFRALTAFPGIAGRTETCGGCSGCMLAMGLVFGPDGWGQARSFCDGFEQENGSTQCGQILESNLGRTYRFPEDYAAYSEDGAGAVCVGVVQNAVRIAGGIIFDHLQET